MATEPRGSGNMAIVVLVALLVIALVAFAAFSLIGNNNDGTQEDGDDGGIDVTLPPATEGASLQYDLAAASAVT